MRNWIPLIGQLQDYDLRQDMKSDLNAALIVAIMLIPQGMAYAMLAGLPPVMGLYASTVPIVIYALLGSSRQLAVGPVAMVSLLVYTGVSGIAEPGSEEYIAYVLLLALMVGVIQLLLGLLRLGAVTKYISHAVISGFTSAAAIIIAFSQMDSLLGTDLGESKNVFIIMIEAVQNIGNIQAETFFIGLASIVVLFLMKKYTPKIPGPLTVVVLSIAAVQLFNLEQTGVEVVGEIPGGLPGLTIPAMSADAVLTLLPIAVTISLIGFVESYAMAKVIATRERYAVHPDQELRALGAANIGTGFFSGFPVTGGFSRSAVNYDSGAKTGLAGMMTAVFVILTLLFFTSWFYYLPQAVLAAIIIVAVYGLIDVKEPKHLWQVKRADAVTLAVTFIATLAVGIEAGIITGVGFSLAVFLYRSGKPHMAELGYLESEGVYRNIKRFPQAKTDDDKLIIRIDAPIYFANMAYIEEQLRHYMLEHPRLTHVIFDFSSVNDIDAVAVDELEKWLDHHGSRGIRFYFVTVHGPVRDIFKRAGWDEKFAGSLYYRDLNEAHKAASSDS
ncbi:SulP family inorganic anion transporter [Salisediminibacterium halotolerans]|uniref:Sulfate permease, SulP family n=1 Tax=Salisediminibacterium halotolerans TaxID=517425 RepID=A0A1H9WD26_9BACI|nr:sulfate permease [Salisediminibacterium haloalkalitolerans]SES31836.1 sulfate permease, SulP family [Salisediminibacterium haloalkalitolerans]